MIEIYGLTDESGTVRYVGQSQNSTKRFWWHQRAAVKRYKSAKGRVYNWLRSVFERGAEPGLVVLETCGDSLADDREIWWVTHYRTLGHDLVNNTAGGGGLRGWEHSEETKAKIGARHRGKTVSDETRRKVSAAKTGVLLTEEHRLKISEGGKGREVSAVTRRKLSDSLRGNQNGSGTVHSPESVSSRARKVSGEANVSATTTNEIAEEIRAKCAAGRRQSELAEEYGLSRVTVHRIVTGKTYRSPPTVIDPEAADV